MTTTSPSPACSRSSGYMLTSGLKHQKMFLIVGPKRSGKGTIAEIIRQLVGPMNTASPGLNSLGPKFGMQTLIGKQVAIISDARLTQRTDLAVLAKTAAHQRCRRRERVRGT